MAGSTGEAIRPFFRAPRGSSATHAKGSGTFAYYGFLNRPFDINSPAAVPANERFDDSEAAKHVGRSAMRTQSANEIATGADCDGCLVVKERGDVADLKCNSCGAMIDTVPLDRVGTRSMELASDEIVASGVRIAAR